MTRWVDEFSTPVNGADRDEILDYAEQQGMDREVVDHTITDLLESGKLQEPQGGRVRTT